MKRLIHMLACVVSLLPAARATQPVGITIDLDSTYQTIDGFGAYGAKCPFWSGCTDYTTPAFVDLVVNELGVSIIRMEINNAFEPENDNSDPHTANLSAFRSATDPLGFGDDVIAYLRAMNEAMNVNGDTLRVICSIWSPPNWMKVNNSCCGTDKNTNTLAIGMEEELAEFMAVFCRVFREQVGIDLYGISMQNEPAFAQTFGSCYYSAARYLEVFTVVGRRFEQNGITTRLFGPEHVGSFQRMASYAGPIANDPEAKQYLDVLATHGYDFDGSTPGSLSLQDWQRSTALAQVFKGVLWQTETGGGPTWPEAFDLGLRIHQALRHGRISAWMHWCLSSKENTQENRHHLINNYGRVSTVLNQGYVTAAFARHIRPGAVQVGSASSDSLVQVVAFVHPQDRTMSVVLLNRSESQQTVSLSGEELPSSFSRYLTSATESHTSQGTVTTGSVALPALSITTLEAADVAASMGLGVQRSTPVRQTLLVDAGQRRLYSLDGRRLTGTNKHRTLRVVVTRSVTAGPTQLLVR